MRQVCRTCRIELDEAAFERRDAAGTRRRTCRACRNAKRAQLPQPKTRVCSSCATEKPIAEYYPNQGRRRKTCKTCEASKEISPLRAERKRVGARRYYQENRDRLLAAVAAHRLQPETRAKRRERWRRNNYAAKQRDYYWRNAERRRELAREWQASHPEHVRARFQRRRARLAGVESTLTHAEWCAILDSHCHRCAYCHERSRKLEMDHVLPVSAGGGTTADNVVPACRSCNASKGDKPVHEFMQALAQRIQAA